MRKPEHQDTFIKKQPVACDAEDEGRRFAEAILSTMRQPLVVLNNDLRIELANHAFFQTFNVAVAETEGRLIYELGDGQWDIPRLHDLLENVLPEDNALDNYEIDLDFGELGCRTMVLNAGRDDHMQRILLAIEDQTGARRADLALLKSEWRRRQVLDNLSAFVGLLNPEGVVIEINRAALEVAGIELADVQGRRFEDCCWWSYSAEVQAQLRQAIGRAALGEHVRYDVEIQAAHSRLTIDFMLAPLRDDAGAITGLIPSAVDITEHRLRQQMFQTFSDDVPDAFKYAVPSLTAARSSGIAEVAATRFARLTPREREVLELVAAGQLNKEVAYRLGINQRTVENHRARGMQRLGARSLAELVRLAVAAESTGLRVFPQ